MGLTGKYNFPGMQKAGRAAVKAALASTSWGTAFVASVWFKIFSPVEDALIDGAINALANRGLIVLNIGGSVVSGKFDQSAFDKSMAEGLQKVRIGADKLTPEQGRMIDDAIRKTFDKDADLGASVAGLSKLSNPSV